MTGRNIDSRFRGNDISRHKNTVAMRYAKHEERIIAKPPGKSSVKDRTQDTEDRRQNLELRDAIHSLSEPIRMTKRLSQGPPDYPVRLVESLR
jgi:hypothetical protein